MSNTVEAIHEVLEESSIYQLFSDEQKEEAIQEYMDDLDQSGADLEYMLNKEDRA